MKKLTIKIMSIVMILAICIGKTYMPVSASDNADINAAQYAVCYLTVAVEDADGAIMETTHLQSSTIAVSGDVYTALSQAESSLEASANAWMSGKSRFSCRTAYEYATENSEGIVTAVREVTWHTTSNSVPAPPVIEEESSIQESESQTSEPEEIIPLEAYGASAFYCGPSAGDYVITVNQPVEVNKLIFGPYGITRTHWGTSQSNGSTYVTINKNMINTVNDIKKDRGYTILLETDKGNVSVYLMVYGFYDRNDPDPDDWYYNEQTGLWESLSGKDYPVGVDINSPENLQQNSTPSPDSNSENENTSSQASEIVKEETSVITAEESAASTEEEMKEEESSAEEVKTYTFTESAASTTPVSEIIYNASTNEDMTLYISGIDEEEMNELVTLMIDGEVVPKEAYILGTGAASICFKADYLATLTEGTHLLSTTFEDGSSLYITIMIDAEITTNSTPSGVWIAISGISAILIISGILYWGKKRKNKV